jgi:hypothetical protein
VFIGWGDGNPNMTEFSHDGNPLYEALIQPKADDTYRAYRLPWHGATAENSPDAKAYSGKSGTDVYVSWNGATDVDKWIVQVGSDPANLEGVAQSDWKDFETRIHVKGSPKYIRVKAVNSDGQQMGHTDPFAPKHV